MNLMKKASFVAAAVAVIFTAHHISNARPVENTSQLRFRMLITVPDTDRPEFSVPGVGGMFAVIPTVADKAEHRSEGRPTYIMVTPQREGDRIRIRVSVLYGKFDTTEPIHDQLKDLKEKPVAEFLVVSDEKVSVSQLKQFGVKPIEIKVIPDDCAPSAQL